MTTFSAKVAKTTRPARCCAAKAHSVDRRQTFGLVAAGLLTAMAPAAQALSIPSQESTGSSGKRGSLPPNSSEASMGSYGMEGIKKRGIDAKRKNELLEELRKSVTAEGGK